MKSKQFVALIILSLGISLFSQGAMAERERGQFKKMMKSLDLTQEQQDKMKELKKNKPNVKESRKEMRELRKKFKESMESNATEAELRKLHSQIQEKKSAMAKDRFEQMLKVRSILTPEQRKKFQGMRHEGGEHMGRGKRKNH